MRITEKHLREFFPRDMRFTHFVAKRFGYILANDDLAEQANSDAMERVLSIYNEGREFESNEELYGFVMSTIRFAIMNCFSKKRGNKSLIIKTDSELTFGEKDDEYSVFKATAVIEPDAYDNTIDFYIDALKDVLTEEEFKVFETRYKYGYTDVDVADRAGISVGRLTTVTRNIKQKFNQLKEKTNAREISKRTSAVSKSEKKLIVRRNNEAHRELQAEARRRHLEEKKRQRDRSTEAMSWLNLEPQI